MKSPKVFSNFLCLNPFPSFDLRQKGFAFAQCVCRKRGQIKIRKKNQISYHLREGWLVIAPSTVPKSVLSPTYPAPPVAPVNKNFRHSYSFVLIHTSGVYHTQTLFIPPSIYLLFFFLFFFFFFLGFHPVLLDVQSYSFWMSSVKKSLTLHHKLKMFMKKLKIWSTEK